MKPVSKIVEKILPVIFCCLVATIHSAKLKYVTEEEKKKFSLEQQKALNDSRDNKKDVEEELKVERPSDQTISTAIVVQKNMLLEWEDKDLTNSENAYVVKEIIKDTLFMIY
ncbi:MAG: hypothetical protein V1855_01135, partial [bacterium]